MASIFLMNKHGLNPKKRVFVSGVTRLDHAKLKNEENWISANCLTHDASVLAVNVFGRHIFEVGETISVKMLEGSDVEVNLISIHLVETDKLTDLDYQAVGYENRVDYMSDWGDVFGTRLWFYIFRYIDDHVA